MKRKINWQAILIPGLIVLPMLVATVMFYTGWGVPANTINKGELLSPPISIEDLSLSEQDQTLTRLYQPEAKKQWRLLVPVAQNCDEICQQNLYLTRQVHIRLAEKAYRLERVLLLMEKLPDNELERLKAEHPETVIVYTTPESLSRWLSPTQITEDTITSHYYMVDQQGFAMMAYDTSHEGQDLLSDIKRVLKYTYDK